MSEPERALWREKNRVIVAVYADEKKTEAIVRRLIDKGCQMDLISVLGQLHASGDDTLGIYHLNVGDRMKAWGKQGLCWGGLWGLLAGAAGLLMIPGVGAVAAAGYIVEAIAGGAVVGAGTMGGAAALSQLAVAYHRVGIPEAKIESLHKVIEDGKYVLMMRGAASELEQWQDVIASGEPVQVDNLPYSRIVDQASRPR